MGEYEPNDSRDVTLKPGHEPGGIERTGPREGETREGTKNEGAGEGREPEGGVHDLNTGAIGERQAGDTVVGETSTDPARRARADADRPL
jgi:hypothetical protein